MRIFTLLAVTLLFSVTLLTVTGYGESAGQQQPVIIDARTEAEWQGGHLQGAVLVPHDTIGTAIAKLAPAKSTRILLYCRSGRRSGIALETLQKLGYDQAVNLGTMEQAAKELNRPIIK